MRPTPTTSAFFSADQEWQFRVRSWDTPYTTLENDEASEGLKLRVFQPLAESVNWSQYATALKAVASGSSPESAFTNGSFASAAVADGRWPLVQSYWGSGTPNWWGGAYTGRVALCFQGALVARSRRQWLADDDVFTFAVAGSGWVRIDVVEGATRTTLFKGDVSESDFLENGFRYSSTHTFSSTSTLHVYYVQDKTDSWGGLVIRAIPTARPTDANSRGPIAKAAAQAAPLLAASLFSHADVQAVELPYILSVNVNHEQGSAIRADIEVPLVNPAINDGSGWVFYQPDPETDPGSLRVYDAGDLLHTLKRKRLIQIEVAKRAETPSWMPIFTGQVDDFGSGSTGRLQITCVSFEGRMVEQYEQAPDRISYMARGFQVLDYADVLPVDRKQPVYNVPAFDNWPLAWAVEELGIRAGIDPICFRRLFQAVQDNGNGRDVEINGALLKRFRADTLSGEPLRLPRAVHYGNVGLSFTETRPYDDDYVFKVEPTKDLWARARELTDRVGYICRFDVTGAAVLFPANSPSYVHDITTDDVKTGTATEVINPAAYGATYMSAASGATPTFEVTVYASRVDISFPRASGIRDWIVTVTPSDVSYLTTQSNQRRITELGEPRIVTVSEGYQETQEQVHVAATVGEPELFFDSAVTAPGGNSTVYTAYTGDYLQLIVTLQPVAGTTPAYVDCILAYAQDPDNPKLPALSTLDAALTVQTKTQQDAVRNKVTIVGRRKAAVTDSDKFAEAQAPTEQEFVVQNAIDLGSITDRTATNYVGYLKQSVIYDEAIADDGLAKYLAQVFIYRQSVPRVGTTVTHTLLPMLEITDPVAVEESKFNTVTPDTTQYVRKIQHRIDLNKFQTTIETEPWPDYPAYQPRTDIDLSKFDNKPVTGLTVDYVSLSGHSYSNPSPSLVKQVIGNTVAYNGLSFGGTTLSMPGNAPWPPVPGTFQIKGNFVAGGRTAVEVPKILEIPISGRWQPLQLIKTFGIPPEWTMQGVRVKLYSDAAATKVALDSTVAAGSVDRSDYFYYEETDGVISLFRGQKALTGGAALATEGKIFLSYRVGTDRMNTGWLSNNPYHEFYGLNYTSVGVSLPWAQGTTTGVSTDEVLTFDVRYRSLFPVGGGDPNGIAGGVSKSPFYDPYTSELGNLVNIRFSVLAEGMYRVSIRNWEDHTVVGWLTNPASDANQPEQHWEYLPVMADKVFTWDGVDQLGLWNAVQSELYSELVEGTFEDDQKPRVGRGFYVWNQEVGGGDLGPLAYIWLARNVDGVPIIGHGTYARWYVHIEAETTTPAERELSSKDDDVNVAILTHLPEPTKLELKVEDKIGASWGALPPTSQPSSLTAYINNDKPIRIRFKVAPRPGVLWAGKDSQISVKLTREVHLRAIIGDQVVVYAGKEFPGTTVEDRAVYSRRLTNDEHTKQYTDSGYRKASTFRWDDATDPGDASTEWVFYPRDFKKDFLISGYEQSIEFGDYLQLEEVPQWNGARATATARSRLQFALMSYLFYLSAYVTDRSGRSSWGINRSFVDKSKIYTNTQALNWPTDPMYEQRRTVVCRQWTEEADWKANQLTAFGYSANTLFAKLLQSFWYQHDVSATNVGTTPVSWSAFGTFPQDTYSANHAAASVDGYRLPLEYSASNVMRQLGSVAGAVSSSFLGANASGGMDVGTWEWESSPLWIPSITRDLHPYFLLPPMVSPPAPPFAQSTFASFTNNGEEADLRGINMYWTIGGSETKVKVRAFGSDNTIERKTSDAGAAQTWSSPTVDMTGSGTALKFNPGFRVDVTKGMFKDGVPTNAINYVRQDETVHWEDLRGIYSRGPYPAAAPTKVAAGSPYYVNPHRYKGIQVSQTLNVSSYPLFQVLVDRTGPSTTTSPPTGAGIDWFRTSFRSEYVWESGSMFPTNRFGKERLDGVMWWRHRFIGFSNNLYYDYGAWTGWKDDDLNVSTPKITGGFLRNGNYSGISWDVGGPFTTGHMPVGVGPVLPQTTELTCHLVLLPERRGS
jgi:hypothetical protein